MLDDHYTLIKRQGRHLGLGKAAHRKGRERESRGGGEAVKNDVRCRKTKKGGVSITFHQFKIFDCVTKSLYITDSISILFIYDDTKFPKYG